MKNVSTVKSANRSLGFTLLEVLVALAILAISATAVIRQTGTSLQQLSSLQQRTIALVLAENQLNLAILTDSFPALGRSSEEVSFYEQRWLINTEVSATSDPWLRKVEVSVALGGADTAITSLVAYRGRY